MKVSTYSLIFTLPSVLAVCNPLTSSDCSPVPALGTSFKQDWSQEIGPYFTELPQNGEITFSDDDGISLTMNKQGDNPTIQSNFYIMFGKVEVVLKAATGTGIISSFYLQSDDLDEIDIELFGGDDYEFQSNYFIKGSTVTYDRGQFHPVNPGPLSSFHTYTIDWNPDVLTWSLDGNVVRTITKDNAQGYPQTPMQIIAGAWAGGDPNNAPGTIEWAGGLTDFADAPFTMSMKSIIVSDYSSGKTYSYSGTSGSWESIVAEDGEVDGREDEANQEFSQLQSGGTVDSKDVSQTFRSSTSSATSSKSSTETLTGSSTGSIETTTTSTATSGTSSSSSAATVTVSSSTGTKTTATSKSAVLKPSGNESSPSIVGPQVIGQSGSKSGQVTTAPTGQVNTQTNNVAASSNTEQTTGSTVFISTGTTQILTSVGEAAIIKSSLLGLVIITISYLFI